MVGSDGVGRKSIDSVGGGVALGYLIYADVLSRRKLTENACKWF